MERFGWIIGVVVAVYVAVCFGKIAAKYGKNPVLYGMLSFMSPINLIILGYWAFSDGKTPDKANMTSHS
jgi:chromate transport protein ChrA